MGAPRSSQLVVASRPKIEVGGDAAQIREDLVRLEVALDLDGPARLEASFLNWGPKGNPNFFYFDGTFDLGKQIAVRIGDPDTDTEVFKGKITAVHGLYAELRVPEILVRAEDQLTTMRMREPSRHFAEKTDADMAREIAPDYGLGADATVDGPSYRSFWQVNHGDLAFLRERARAVDAKVVVKDGKLELKPRDEPDGPLIPHTRLGEILYLDVGADLAHQRSKVRVHGWSVKEKKGIHEEATAGDMTPGAQGRTGPQLVSELGVDAVEDMHVEMPATKEEAKKLAKALGKRIARSFVTAHGITDGTPPMAPGSRLDLADLGPYFEGEYLVTEVRHTYDNHVGHRTRFVAERNWMGG